VIGSGCSTDPALKAFVGTILYLHFLKYRHARAMFLGLLSYIDFRPCFYLYELRTGVLCLAAIQEGEFIQASLIAGFAEPNGFRLPILERLEAQRGAGC
jgi:hypothetical protein